jgi:hypothetical protein
MKKNALFLVFICLVYYANAQWQQLNGPFGLDIASVGASGNNIFAGTLADGLYVSFDNGQTWSLANGVPDYKYIYSIAKSGQYIFAGEYRSTNNGLNWSIMGNGFPSCCVTSLAAEGSTVLVGAYNGGSVRVSNDYGLNWSSAISGPDSHEVYAVAVSGTNLFAGAEQHGAFLSTDNGATWNAINNGLTSLDVRNFGVNGSSILASTYGGKYLTTDTGANWSNVNNGLSINHGQVACFNSNFLVVGDGDIHISYDMCQSWISVNEGLESHGPSSVAIDGSYIYVGTYLAGVWRRPLSELGLAENNENARFNVFPNPALDKITIQNKTQNNDAVLSIYNMKGQLFLHQALQQEKTELNINNLVRGVYILKLVCNDKIDVKKLVKE